MKKIILTLLSAVVVFGASAQQPVKDFAKCYRYAKANTEITQAPRVVFMGDSITEGWASKHPEFFTDNNFAGRGISGQTSWEMLLRFRADVINLAPKAVVILAGTNDVAQNKGPMTYQQTLDNIISMVELAKANKIKVVLCAILPADRFSWRPDMKPAQDVIEINKLIKAYAEENKIPYVDYHTLLDNGAGGLSKEHAPDGVHPVADAYTLMEAEVMKTLKKVVKIK